MSETGEALSIEVSLFDALTEWMSHPIYATMYTGQQPPRRVPPTPTFPRTGPFRAADGVVLLGIQNEREWVRFCADVLIRPELAADEQFATNSKRSERREELTELIEEAFSALSVEQVLGRLDAAQIANARQNDVAGLISHPQLTERDRWSEVHTSVGPVAALRSPAILNGLAGGIDDRFDPVPALGEHTEAILDELGLA